MDLQLLLALNVTDFTINVQAEEPQIHNTQVAVDNVGMFYHDYDQLLTNVLIAFTDDFNLSHPSGIDLKKTTWGGMLANLLRETEVSTGVQPGFLYAGFSWITDV